jgi:hypothetical protein
LREIHLGVRRPRKSGPSVGERLQAAYEKVMAKKTKEVKDKKDVNIKA